MSAVIWLIAAMLLAAAEVIGGEMFLLMLAGGALATAGVAVVADDEWLLQGIVFAAVSVLLTVLLRPVILRRLRNGNVADGVAALEGKAALVLEAVTKDGGQVKLDGEVWTARSLDEFDSYEAGTSVRVFKIDGATALVWKEP